MALRDLVPWHRNREHEVPVRRSDAPAFGLQHDVNHLFEDFWRSFDAPFEGVWRGLGAPAFGGSHFAPTLDVAETDEAYQVTAELPGLEEKDFEVQLEGDVLTLRGEKRQERQVGESGSGQVGWTERSYGSFQRAIRVPQGIDPDRVSAEYRNGVLTVTLPKSEDARRQRRTIEVRAG